MNYPNIVRQLLVSGADTSVADTQGSTALMYGAESGSSDITLNLMRAGANMETKNEYNVPALMFAARFGHLKVVRLLCDAGADSGSQNAKERTSLLFAANNGALGSGTAVGECWHECKLGPGKLEAAPGSVCS